MQTSVTVPFAFASQDIFFENVLAVQHRIRKENPAHKSQIYIQAAICVAVKIAKCVKKKS